MATVQIKIDQTGQPAGVAGQSREDLVEGALVSMSIPSHPSPTSVQWTLIEKPPTSSVVPSGLNSPVCTWTPDVPGGTWLFDVVVDGDRSSTVEFAGTPFSTKHTTQGGAAVKLKNGDRVPAFNETFQFGTKGWATAMDAFIRRQARGQLSSDFKVGASVAALPGEETILLPGTHVLGAVSGSDPDITDATASISVPRGSVLSVTATRTIASAIDLSKGGQLKAGAGAVVSLTGRLNIPPNHHAFDISAGGTFQIAATSIHRLTPYNFGAKGDNVTDDSAAVRAWIAACLWSAGDANGGIVGNTGGGRFVIGGIMDVDERGNLLFARLNKTGSTFHGSARRVTSFRFAPAPAWVADTEYLLASVVTLGGNIYRASVPGTSAPSGGPTGTGSGIVDGDVEWDYVGADDGSLTFTAFRLEEQPETEPSLYFKLGGWQISANADTTRRKIAFDCHDVRRLILEEVEVSGWTDTSNATGTGSIGIDVRGRDIIVIADPYLDCDLPIRIGFNDNENEPLDGNGIPTVFRDASGKDDDHVTIVRGGYQCSNAYKTNILIPAGAVVRNLEIQGDITWIDGAILTCVDRADSGGVPFAGAEIPPRRRSNTWRIGSGRIEGAMGSTGYAVRIERHMNAKLEELEIDGVLLGERMDCRRNMLVGGTTGLTGAAWNGLKLLGVRRPQVGKGVRYSGAGTSFQADADADITIEVGAELVPTEHKRRWPEHSSQFDYIKTRMGHQNFLGIDHWYPLTEGSGTHASFSGAFPLGRTGSADPVLRQLLDDWDRYWLGFTNVGGQRIQLGVVDAALALASHSKMFGCVVRIDPTWTPGAITGLMNLAGDSNGPAARLDTTGHPFMAANGTSGAATTMNLLDGVPALITAAHNRTGTSLTGLITKLTGQREPFSHTYFAAPSNLSSQGWGAIAGINSFQGLLGQPFICLDAKAEQSQAALHDALGWVEF